MLPDPAIPGQTPLDDLSGLRLEGIRTTAELNSAEAENVRKAVLKYLAARPTPRSAPFDFPWLCRLHGEMFGDVWAWAGTLRRGETNIGCRPHEIQERLHALLEDLRAWKGSGMGLEEQAVRLHHVAVQIHPFRNGNGRWSRMLANVWLKRHGGQPIEWPETTIGTASTVRESYLQAIRAADAHDYAALSALHQRFGGRGSRDSPDGGKA